MNVRPILFSGPMVRALLSGTKTQTRRPVKTLTEYSDRWVWRINQKTTMTLPIGERVQCPFGEPGDRLWVRETWADWEQGVAYRADGQWLMPHNRPGHPDVPHEIERLKLWKPSIHMKRHKSRIQLEVVSARVERVQEVTDEGARAEGVDQAWCNYGLTSEKTFRHGFIKAWNEIYSERFSFGSNPFVWVISFRKLG